MREAAVSPSKPRFPRASGFFLHSPSPTPHQAETGKRRTEQHPAMMPEWIRPQLTQLVDAASEGDQWLCAPAPDEIGGNVRLKTGGGAPRTMP